MRKLHEHPSKTEGWKRQERVLRDSLARAPHEKLKKREEKAGEKSQVGYNPKGCWSAERASHGSPPQKKYS